MLIRLRLAFSHLREHKLSTVLKTHQIRFVPETTTYYFLRCHFYNSNRATFINDLEIIPISFPTISENNLIVLFFIWRR